MDIVVMGFPIIVTFDGLVQAQRTSKECNRKGTQSEMN